jgi:hypothetical protein
MFLRTYSYKETAGGGVMGRWREQSDSRRRSLCRYLNSAWRLRTDTVAATVRVPSVAGGGGRRLGTLLGMDATGNCPGYECTTKNSACRDNCATAIMYWGRKDRDKNTSRLIGQTIKPEGRGTGALQGLDFWARFGPSAVLWGPRRGKLTGAPEQGGDKGSRRQWNGGALLALYRCSCGRGAGDKIRVHRASYVHIGCVLKAFRYKHWHGRQLADCLSRRVAILPSTIAPHHTTTKPHRLFTPSF